MGLLLWNVIYNTLLLRFLDEATVISFSNGLAVVVAVKHPENVEVHQTEMMRVVGSWQEKTRLILADEKREAILRTNCRKEKRRLDGSRWTYGRFKTGYQTHGSVRLGFREHLEYACQKAANGTAALVRMLPNIDRLKHCSRSGAIKSALRVACVSGGT